MLKMYPRGTAWRIALVFYIGLHDGVKVNYAKIQVVLAKIKGGGRGIGESVI